MPFEDERNKINEGGGIDSPACNVSQEVPPFTHTVNAPYKARPIP